jgi:hypothetical protein
MSRHFSMRVVLAAALALIAIFAPAASAAPVPSPAWSLQATAAPSYFVPGDASGGALYDVFLTNSGAVPSDGSPITIVDTLPAGLGVKKVEVTTERQRFNDLNGLGEICDTQTAAGVATVTCELTEAPTPGVSAPTKPALVDPGEQVLVKIRLTVPDGEAVVPLTNQVAVQGGGAEAASAESDNRIDPACKDTRECTPAGFQTFRSNLTGADGKAATGAASHPFQFTSAFAVNLNLAPAGSMLPYVPARGDLKRIEVTLPPGLIANPTVTALCTARQFNATHGTDVGSLSVFPNECPDASAVGVALLQQIEGKGEIWSHAPIYSLVPPPGMPAQFGFQPTFGLPVFIDTALVRGPEGFTVRAFLRNITEAKRVTSAQTIFWGTPADPSHDPLRGHCALLGGNCPANLPVVQPSFRLPSSCENPLTTTMSFTTWAQPPTGASASASEPAPVACEQPDFSPSIESKPSTNVTDSPSGLDFTLHLPQKANEDPEGLSEADLRDATVTLPQGLVLNPAAADGRAACTPAQVGLTSGVGGSPILFDQASAACPDASKVGRIEVDTPLLAHPINGSVYLASQTQNPFNSLLAIYIALEDPAAGITIKLAGKVTPDPITGQLTTSFPENPQVPFEDLRFEFFEGARAPLRTPPTCGPHTTNTSLVPWSAPAGATAFPSDSFTLAQAPGGACASSAAQLPNTPFFEAGTTDPLAASYSPVVLRLKREDGSQEIAGLHLTLPQGLTGKLAGIAECSEAALAQAKARELPGQGAVEKASPSCPASSRIGTVTVGAGAGPAPFHTQGEAYLAGPYKGAPLSMAIITPAVAGPFDLGAVVVRAALRVDPESARITAASDPIPQIIQGIPLDVRSIAVKLDRPGFTLNPTSCEAMAISGEAISVSGQVAPLNNRFQVGGCSNLGFKPKLAFKLKGETKRGGFPALTATLTYPKAGAYSNIARAQVALPHSEFLAQAHIRTICTRVQFAANSCPKGSIYGKARAITPLLDKPLEGPVYLRSSSNPLPDLVADLNGQIHVALVGRVDSVNGGIRNSFEAVPDAPVSKFTLSLPAGKKGLLENSTDICRGKHEAKATFTAHNGKVLVLKPELEAKCKAKSRKGSKARRSNSRRP